jgi:hypothetical protein
MHATPPYVWLITITGVIAVPSVTCAQLRRGAQRAGMSPWRVATLTGSAAILLGGWVSISALIAHDGGYRTRLGHGVPWMPVAVLGVFTTLVALSRVPVVAAAMNAPRMTGRLLLPHALRVTGIAFLLTMALGGLPALFAVPAGLGDIATGIAALRISRTIKRRTGRRAAVWFNVFGTSDLVVALTLGALVGFQLIHTAPTGAAITKLPLALIPSAEVPLLLALHVTSLLAIRNKRYGLAPAVDPLASSALDDGAPLTHHVH